MLEEIYEDNLIGDPNDLEEIIEQHGDQFGEADEQETEDNTNNGTSLISQLLHWNAYLAWLLTHKSWIVKLTKYYISTSFYVII